MKGDAAMQAHADPLAPALERASKPRWRARPHQDRRDVSEFDNCEVGRDAYPASHREVGSGSVVVASIWLAFYVIAAFHSLPSGN